MKFLRTAVCSLMAVALLAACGNATAGMAFKVPADYQSKLNMFGMEMWTNAAAPNPSVIMLITIPKKFDPSKAGDFNFNDVPNSSMKNAKLLSHQQITMCGSQVAFKATAEATKTTTTSSPAPGATATTTDQDVDMVVTGWGDKTYMAMYVHAHAQAADKASEDALMTLCPSAAS